MATETARRRYSTGAATLRRLAELGDSLVSPLAAPVLTTDNFALSAPVVYLLFIERNVVFKVLLCHFTTLQRGLCRLRL